MQVVSLVWIGIQDPQPCQLNQYPNFAILSGLSNKAVQKLIIMCTCSYLEQLNKCHFLLVFSSQGKKRLFPIGCRGPAYIEVHPSVTTLFTEGLLLFAGLIYSWPNASFLRDHWLNSSHHWKSQCLLYLPLCIAGPFLSVDFWEFKWDLLMQIKPLYTPAIPFTG